MVLYKGEKWEYKGLDELGYIGRGKSRHRPRNDPSLYGGKYPFVQTGDVKASDFYITQYEQTYNEKGLAQSKIWPKGTLCITIAANIAETAILGIEACFPDSIVGFIPNKDKADVRFVKYYIDTIKLKMQQISRGTTQDNLSLDKLLSFKILTPPLPTQRKIAAILSAYDDMIENNTRRIKILEEMAQLIYKEWFVKFRFPGHEKVRMVESELGPIPEGWEVKKVSAIAKIFRGKSYKSSDIANDGEGLPFLNLKCIERDGGFRYDGIKWFSGQYKETQIAKAGDIIMAITDMTQERQIVARAARVPRMFNVEKYVFSMDLVKIVPLQKVVNEYLYSVFRYSTFPDKVKQYANGANVLHLNPDHIANFEMLIAPTYLQNKYANIVKDLYAECDVLQMKNNTLRRTRDLLLPKLISGELDVEDLDIAVGGD